MRKGSNSNKIIASANGCEFFSNPAPSLEGPFARVFLMGQKTKDQPIPQLVSTPDPR